MLHLWKSHFSSPKSVVVAGFVGVGGELIL
jgi:hypothetical protein